MDNITKLLHTPKTVFSVSDLKLIWDNIPEEQVKQYTSYYTKKKHLIRVHRGLYALPGREVNPFELGNKIRSPSYLSFETVLYQEGIIFQWQQSIRFASYESRVINAFNNRFEFSQLKDSVLLLPTGVSTIQEYSIASKERAMVDVLYLNPSFHFDNVRDVDFSMVKIIAAKIDHSSIKQSISHWEEYARSL